MAFDGGFRKRQTPGRQEALRCPGEPTIRSEAHRPICGDLDPPRPPLVQRTCGKPPRLVLHTRHDAPRLTGKSLTGSEALEAGYRQQVVGKSGGHRPAADEEAALEVAFHGVTGQIGATDQSDPAIDDE